MYEPPQFNAPKPHVFATPIACATPSRPSGFGAVMEQENDLQSSTDGYLGPLDGLEVNALDQVLRDQHARLGANISLLERRYETLPHPARFQALRTRLHPPAKARRVSERPDILDLLRNLVAQHRSLLSNIDVLIAHGTGESRGGHLMTEMARNHEAMAGMLSGLLNDMLSVRDLVPIPIIAQAPVRAAGSAEVSWENEGGAPLAVPAVVRLTDSGGPKDA
jgi:hypothetical protein